MSDAAHTVQNHTNHTTCA